MPLVLAFDAAWPRRRRERGAVALGALVLLYMALALATPHSPWLQARLLASGQFRPPSMASWVVLQPAPKMYGFANQVWRGPFLLIDHENQHVEEGRFSRGSFWVNHYPGRMARYDGERARVFAKPGSARFIVMRSSYRSVSAWSALEVVEHDAELHMRSIDVEPP